MSWQQEIYDAWKQHYLEQFSSDPDKATGKRLDELCELTGTRRKETAMERGTRLHKQIQRDLDAGRLLLHDPGVDFAQECATLPVCRAPESSIVGRIEAMRRGRATTRAILMDADDGWASALTGVGPPPPAAPRGPVLYDGLTAEVCLARFECNQRADGDGTPLYLLTAPQKEVARELWSASLRTRVSDSAAKDAERERNQVVCDDPDYYGTENA